MRLFFLSVSFNFLFSTACSKGDEVHTEDFYLFNHLHSNYSSVDFVNQIREDQDHSILNYIYYYNGGGVAAGDLNNDGLPDLYFVSNQGPNQLFLNKDDLKFDNITDSAGVSGEGSWSTGVSIVDINADGWLDIYVCNVSGLLDFKGHNELFINNGDGTFSERSKEFGLDFQGYSTQSYFFDYDKDGDLDMYLVNHAIHTTLSHANAILREERVPLVGDVLFRNKGGKFEDVSEEANIYGGVNSYGLSAAIADFNGDGWDDIYVCNDFQEDDYLYINNQDGTFSERLAEYFSTISRFSMGSDVSDVNNDGLVDLMTLDMLPKDEFVIKETEGDEVMYNMRENLRNLGYKDQFSRNMLQLNHNGQFFVEAAIMNNVANTDWSWAPLFADFNNDGNQDLFITNGILRRPNGLDFKNYVANSFAGRDQKQGVKWLYNSINEMPGGSAINQIFSGNQTGFKNETGKWIRNNSSLSNGSVYVDLDLDGDLDLVVNNLNAPASIYENKCKSSNFIQFGLKYKGKNIEGIGSKISIYSSSGAQTKWVYKSRGFLSSVDSKIHFGLNDVQNIDSVKIVWPDLKSQTLYNLEVNRDISISYQPNLLKEENNSAKTTSKVFKKIAAIDYEHLEKSRYDFLNERLMPYRVSMDDPALAVGDIDGNGLKDVYIGNSSGNAAKFFLNNRYEFKEKSIECFEQDAVFEDNAALFFDADNDGDLDLYVGSGVPLIQEEKFFVDRLYINYEGDFKKSDNKIPLNFYNTSVVLSFDYDFDGDLDLFVGNRSKPYHFGEPVKSHILRNDGSGNFTISDDFIIEGNVSDAIIKDVNGDEILDLLIALEWDAPKIYLGTGKKFKSVNFNSELKGLWQAIEAFDVDRDGDLDIVLGNWGLNTKFSLNETPITMYYSDFDRNGESEIITTYSINGEEYPLNSLGELKSQMTQIGRYFTTNASFAGKSIDEIFDSSVFEKSISYSINQLASGYIRNDDGMFLYFEPFDKSLQTAPIRVFLPITIKNDKGLLVFGNALDVNTYHGGYSSLKGSWLKSANEFIMLSDLGIDPLSEQVKAAALVNFNNQDMLIIVSNNSEIKTFIFN